MIIKPAPKTDWRAQAAAIGRQLRTKENQLHCKFVAKYGTTFLVEFNGERAEFTLTNGAICEGNAAVVGRLNLRYGSERVTKALTGALLKGECRC